MSNESTVSVQVPAELQKISEAVISGISDFKAGKTWQQISVSALPVVFAELGSFDEIKAELSSDKLPAFIGLALGGVAGVFLAKAAVSMMAKRAEKKMLAAKPVVHPEAHEVAAQ